MCSCQISQACGLRSHSPSIYAHVRACTSHMRVWLARRKFVDGEIKNDRYLLWAFFAIFRKDTGSLLIIFCVYSFSIFVYSFGDMAAPQDMCHPRKECSDALRIFSLPNKDSSSSQLGLCFRKIFLHIPFSLMAIASSASAKRRTASSITLNESTTGYKTAQA